MASDRQRAMTWAQRLKRVFAIDIEICRSCGGKLRVIASIEDSAVIERILEHLGRDAAPADGAGVGKAWARALVRVQRPPGYSALIVGGYAVSFHAQPRATKNIDILIDPSLGNGRAVLNALVAFGTPVAELAPKDFTEPGSFYRMGAPPVMVDILPRIAGVDFAAAWERRVNSEIEAGLVVPFISRDDLLVAKSAAGRPEDLADVAALKKARDALE